MMNLFRSCLPVVVLGGLLTAQETQTPKAATPAPAPAAQEPAKDDAATANDPAIKAIDAFIAEKKISKVDASWKQRLAEPPKQTFDGKSDYFLHMETSEGAIKARLYVDTAPLHATCGIYLARLGFYDSLKFHRIIPGFMAQGGDPTGTGRGGPGYTIDGEYEGGKKHDRPGLLSTANTGAPKTDGSQFFLTFVPTPWLDGKHTIWGEVVDGMPTVKKLEGLGSQSGQVANPPTIKRAWVTVAAKAAPKAEAKPADSEKKGG